MCPDAVSAAFGNGGIEITWVTVADATAYEVYRKDGYEEYQLISTATSPSFSDTSYPKNLTVQYAVKSLSGTFPSPMSDPSESLTEWIRNIKVSKLQYTDRVSLSWEKQVEADEYVVYRGAYINDSPIEIARFSSSDSIVEYSDVYVGSGVPEVNVPYYYQIRWVKTGIEYGSSSPVHLGVYSTSVDTGEPGDDDIQTVSGGTYVQDPSYPPIVYSFGDGDGGVEADVDWYIYEGNKGDAVSVEIQKPASFEDNELYIQFSYNDVLSSPIPISGLSHQEIYDIPDPLFSGESTSLFFKIYPVTGSSENKIGSYTVSISNSL
ncbi:hypothetical protein [Spirochaeta isovalerica]|uniref:Fibronectin type-III domain-containing protein n=1 Tax=Spirochaeta isovalerica TaxID=150 RepID=A0A841R3S1_9SPIO|nr:hypothetical protein [Spirochaeta isovalerica]MBB6478466.1 hypothetical protein [Spirochaeta isovalerica]